MSLRDALNASLPSAEVELDSGGCQRGSDADRGRDLRHVQDTRQKRLSSLGMGECSQGRDQVNPGLLM